MNNLTISGFIQDKRVEYTMPGWREQFDKFKSDNEGKQVSITFEMVDSPLHYLFKYYWGYLLPDISFAMGERNIYKVHIYLKKMFNLVHASSFEEIPKKYFKRGWCKLSLTELDNLDSIEYLLSSIKGVILVIHGNGIFGYIKSCADMTHREMSDYTKKVEHLLFVDLNGRLGEEGRDARQAQSLRDKGLDEPCLLDAPAEKEKGTFEDQLKF